MAPEAERHALSHSQKSLGLHLRNDLQGPPQFLMKPLTRSTYSLASFLPALHPLDIPLVPFYVYL
jgi:hypothetical protein